MTEDSSATPSRSASYLGALVFFVGMLRLAILFRRSDGNLVKVIPDDAFYYLVPARNFATLGRWTFDGIEPSSGFHLLWGYLLAGFFHLAPHARLHTIFAVFGTIQVLCVTLAAYLLALTTRRLFGPGVIPGLAVIFFSTVCLQQEGWLMESALDIAASSATVFLLARTSLHFSWRVAAGAFVLGLVLMLSRSDTGLLALVLFLVTLLLGIRRMIERSVPKLAFVLLAGATCGLLLTLLHTHLVSGNWIQGSALQKAFWTQVAGKKSIRPALGVSLSFFDPLFGSRIPFFPDLWSTPQAIAFGRGCKLIVLVLTAWGVLQIFRSQRSAANKGLLASMFVVLLGYYALYSQNSAIQGWYIGNFVTPVALLAAASSAYFSSRTAAVRFGLYLGTAILSVVGIIFSLSPTMRWQEVMYQTGLYLRAHPELSPVGTFNAGIIGFFAEDGVTNLDGLVNDSILPYAKQDRLAAYISKRKIRAIAEFPFVLYDPLYQKEGGYTDGRLLHCVTSATSLFPADPDNNWEVGQIQFFRFDPTCLQTIP